MEFLVKNGRTSGAGDDVISLPLVTEQTANEPGRAFYDSIANLIGLIALQSDETTAPSDRESIRNYLSIEAARLDVLVKDIRSRKANIKLLS